MATDTGSLSRALTCVVICLSVLAEGVAPLASGKAVNAVVSVREDALKNHRSRHAHAADDERHRPFRRATVPQDDRHSPDTTEFIPSIGAKMVFAADPNPFPSEGTLSWATLGAGVVVGVLLTGLTLALLVVVGKLSISFPRKQDSTYVSEPSKSNDSSVDEFGLNEIMVREGSFTGEFAPRVSVLVCLLALQSLSSYILADFGNLIAKHPHLIYFLTMLVGLGGNAGGQSVVLAVRRLALGLDCKVLQQTKIAVALAMVLGPVSYVRATLQGCSSLMAFTIGLSAAVITLISVGCGTLLPTVLDLMGFDPAHSAPMIQVAMDMIGISIVCILGTVLLGNSTADF